MYRLLGLLILGVAISLPAMAMAKKGEKPEKVTIAHFADEMDVEGVGTVEFWRVIRVSSSALDAHLNHGDRLAEEGELPGTSFTVPEGFDDLFDDDGDDDDDIDEEE